MIINERLAKNQYILLHLNNKTVRSFWPTLFRWSYVEVEFFNSAPVTISFDKFHVAVCIARIVYGVYKKKWVTNSVTGGRSSKRLPSCPKKHLYCNNSDQTLRAWRFSSLGSTFSSGQTLFEFQLFLSSFFFFLR